MIFALFAYLSLLIFTLFVAYYVIKTAIRHGIEESAGTLKNAMKAAIKEAREEIM